MERSGHILAIGDLIHNIEKASIGLITIFLAEYWCTNIEGVSYWGIQLGEIASTTYSPVLHRPRRILTLVDSNYLEELLCPTFFRL
jgi:hypothetical protein